MARIPSPLEISLQGDSVGNRWRRLLDAGRWWIQLRGADRVERILGHDVFVYVADDGLVCLFIEKLRRSIELIRITNPQQYTVLAAYVSRILMTDYDTNLWVRHYRMVVLTQNGLVRQPIEEIASILVHESTHARIEHWGVVSTLERRERIERACVRQESRFLRRLPGGHVRAEQLFDHIEQPWWTAEARLERDLKWIESRIEWGWLRSWLKKARLRRERLL